ncbi:MAG TPA: Smr/MutS family protein [Cyclobacteriaceae bacterium]|nr:Smr/MutS family protein [Cyclobacteriaceae bacterium]
MIWPVDLEQKLGFDQVRAMLRNYCLCDLGSAHVDAISFRSNLDEINTLLRRTAELQAILHKGDAFPFSNYFDPAEYLPIIGVEGGFLEEEAFHLIILSLHSIFAARTFLEKAKEDYPSLYEMSREVRLPQTLLRDLQSKFDDTGKIRDNATPELARIRKKLNEERSRIRRLVAQVFRQASSEGWAPEGVSPTIRDGRMVIPLLAEHKRKIRGVTVDQSATGQTIYLEPTEILEANNELRDLELEDRKEVIRILRELTSLIRRHLPDFEAAYQFLGLLDVNRAKAKLSTDLESKLPHTTDGPALKWVNARHPLLYLNLRKAKRNIVPLNIVLDRTDSFLLVSGPNAGGKSVCLKTTGLIQYMFQCGLPVPLEEQSVMGVFDKIFIDIGDQQSIENDLSTYSSHLKNMNHFLTNADDRSLVLLDELGSGTDPNFGGGIAQAVLARLVAMRVWGVATTHYYNLKVFAGNTPGIVNAAMLFNTQKLEPLFMLEIGKPGSSFALEIARKTGLPPDIIQNAEGIIGKDLAGLESLMKAVADDKVHNTRQSAELKKKEAELAEQMEYYERVTSEIESRKKEIIERAKTEASGLLKETNREIEKTIRHIRENKAEPKETRKVREGLKGLEEKVKAEPKQNEHVKDETLKEGDKVRIRGQEVTGTLIQLKGANAVVQFGDLRSHIKVNQLVRSDRADPVVVTKARSMGLDIYKRQVLFESTLDIRGKRVEEVIPALTQFLDDAVLLGQGEVRILHGKGEGVLRKVVREQLKRTKGVSSFADEHVQRGGDGITVVILK